MPSNIPALVRRRRPEAFAFLFLTAFVMPVLTIAMVGGYALGVWIHKLVAGPSGPPAR